MGGVAQEVAVWGFSIEAPCFYMGGGLAMPGLLILVPLGSQPYTKRHAAGNQLQGAPGLVKAK